MNSRANVRYTVSIPDPSSHLAHLELRLTDAAELGASFEVEMAAWCPGSYLIRDYARFVRGLEVTDGEGRALAVTKSSKQSWRIDRAGADEVVIRYRVYGHELTVRTNHIDATHAFLHGPAIYLYVEARRALPADVTIEVPGAWHLSTGLPKHGAHHRAAHLDELFDCPLHLGLVELRELEAAGKPLELAVWGAFDGTGVADMDKLTADVQTIVETHAARFGGAPYDDYTFMLMLAPRAYGGLEHGSSSANLNTPFAMATQNEYGDLLELLSHEFFHVWNGKRIFPAGLAPFEYRCEQYTRCLWVMEGLTSYYDRYTLRNAGLITTGRYLEKLAEEWGKLRMQPGRLAQSLEEASFDAWVKLYQAHESNINTTISYYLKGGLVSLALDFEIRRRTEGARSLVDVLRHLWEVYGSVTQPYPEDVQPVFETATGIGLGEFFDRLVRGTEDPDLAAELATAGLILRETWDQAQVQDGKQPVWCGITLKNGLRVANVIDGSPAATAGLSPDDELIAFDRRRLKTEGGLRKRLGLRRPGDHVEVALFRAGTLVELDLELAASPPTRYEIVAMEDPTEAQQRFYSAWLGEDHPRSGASLGAATVNRVL